MSTLASRTSRSVASESARVTLLESIGVEAGSFADSTGTIDGLLDHVKLA